MQTVIIVSGRRWFERTNGNTYHTAQIRIVNDDGETCINTEREYGYGKQWYWTAMQAIRKHLAQASHRFPGVETVDATKMPEYLKHNGFTLVDSGYVDVPRRKDL